MKCLVNDEGEEVWNHIGLCGVAKLYFEGLFQEKDMILDHIIDILSPHIMEEDNNMLTTPFELEEFRHVMFYMHSDRASSSNSLNLGFYKRY